MSRDLPTRGSGCPSSSTEPSAVATKTSELCPMVSVVPAVAHADGGSAAAAADELFDHGKELLRAGDWPEACARFRASMDLDPAVGTLLKIAKCHEHEDKLTLALGDYRAALALNRAKATQTEQRRNELEEYTKGALAELEARVPKLRVRLAASPPGLRVTIDGAPLPLAAVGEDLPTDAGPMEVVAEAPGYLTAHFSLQQRESNTSEVVVSLVPNTPLVPPLAETRPLPSPRPVAEAPPGSSTRRTLGFVVAGLGVAGLAVAGGFGVETTSKVSASTGSGGGCTPDYHCNQHGVDVLGEARAAQTAAFVSLAAGAAALGAGIYLVVTAPRARASAPAATSVAVAMGQGGLSVRGGF